MMLLIIKCLQHKKRAFKMEVEEASFPRIGTAQSKIILYLGLKIVADFLVKMTETNWR